MPSRIVIVGAGVSGLTCGVVLAERGLDVTLLARETIGTTSAVASAIWYPYHIAPQEKVVRWSNISYREFRRLAEESSSGVSLIDFHVLTRNRRRRLPGWSASMHRRYLSDSEIPAAYRYGFSVEVPLIETPIYLPYLRRRLQRAGGRIQNREITDFAELAEYALAVNCAGLGARELCNDRRLRPGRGIVVMTANPGLAHAMVCDELRSELTYVIPRRNDVVLGGTDDRSEETSVPPAIAEQIHARCLRLESRLPEIQSDKAGIRPLRYEVRLGLERIGGLPVVHNYGHGGAGFTVSWGCAADVLRKVRRVLG
jgi:D-amino-acid oxidase